MCAVCQRHAELVSDADKLSSKLRRRSKMHELSSELVAVQLREASLAVQLNEMKQEALQLETVVCVHSLLYTHLVTVESIDSSRKHSSTAVSHSLSLSFRLWIPQVRGQPHGFSFSIQLDSRHPPR